VRLFVAVEVPEQVRSAVAAAIAPARERAPRLRWVDPAKYHLTLVFLGSVEESRVAGIAEAVSSSVQGVEQFSLALDGRVGTFGRRVLWAGLAPSPQLSAVAGAVTASLRPVVAVPDGDRPFRAHLTLARAGREPVRARAAKGLAMPALTWTVERVVLLRSAGGYSVVEAFPLGA